MNTNARIAAYISQRNGGAPTAKQKRRVNKKVNAGRPTHNGAFALAEYTDDTPLIKASEARPYPAKLVTPPEKFTEAVNPQVRAKVGIITYTGFVVDGGMLPNEFHYKTKGGVAKIARKFTVLDD